MPKFKSLGGGYCICWEPCADYDPKECQDANSDLSVTTVDPGEQSTSFSVQTTSVPIVGVWVNPAERLPDMYEEVLVWVRYYEDESEQFDVAYREEDAFWHKQGWALGSAENFEIIAWAAIAVPEFNGK